MLFLPKQVVGECFRVDVQRKQACLALKRAKISEYCELDPAIYQYNIMKCEKENKATALLVLITNSAI